MASQHDGPRVGLTRPPSWLTRACSSPRETASSCAAQATARCCTRQKQARLEESCHDGQRTVHVGDESGRLWSWTPGRRLRSSNLMAPSAMRRCDQWRIARAPPNPKNQPRPMASPARTTAQPAFASPPHDIRRFAWHAGDPQRHHGSGRRRQRCSRPRVDRGRLGRDRRLTAPCKGRSGPRAGG